MGFLDDVTNAVDRGAAAVGRTTKTAQLKMQLSDLSKRRREIAAQLGASLYEVTKDDATMRVGREELYDGIASLDRQCDDLSTQIQAIEAGAQVRQVSPQSMSCPQCGAPVGLDDMFCTGCGMPIEQIKAARTQAENTIATVQVETTSSPTIACPNCGTPITSSDSFCMRCGARTCIG